MSAMRISEGGWPGGWLVAVVTGLIAVIAARGIGDAAMEVVGLVWLAMFVVFAVVLGMYGSAPATLMAAVGFEEYKRRVRTNGF